MTALVRSPPCCSVSLALAAAALLLDSPASPNPAAPASRWQSDVARLDDAIRALACPATAARSLARRRARSRRIETGRQSAHARPRPDRAAVPRVARRRVSRTRAAAAGPCDATDRLADWATRDADNGLPSLLFAERAQRATTAGMIAYLDEAAARPRFDDYWSRAGLFIWEEVRTLPAGDEAAARVELVATYALARPAYGTASLQALCRDAARFGDAARAACAAAGNAMAQRGSTWSLRTAGARLAERNATTPEAQGRARTQLADVQRRAYDCAQLGNPVASALQSADPAARALAVTQWETRLRREADVGEVAACAAG